MYDRFGLVLMVTHACDLRCSYCYGGRKSARTMSSQIGQTAIDRALRSIRPGGTLELGFFGGEPLLKSDLLLEFLDHAARGCESLGVCLRPHATTNGMHIDVTARRVMLWPGMQISVSHDGLPEVHDRHRRDANGNATSANVLNTIDELLAAGQDVNVVMVVRPDNVIMLPQGIEFLENRGIRHFVPSLDLWTRWTKYDLGRLEEALVSCSEVWWAGLPNCSITWFDEKLAHLTGVGASPTARCGFGNGEVAISAAGYLYPCERLIGEDAPDNPLRLPGHVLQGTDFCPQPAPGRDAEGCSACAIRSFCSTTCRCSNYIRTGDVRRPDGLLCLLDRVCCRETARRLQEPQVPQLPAMPQFQDRAETERKEMHYAE